MNHVQRALFVTLMIFHLSGIAYSQKAVPKNPDKKKTKEEKAYKIKKPIMMTITAAPLPQALKDCSSSVKVLTTEDISLSSASSALGILDQDSGVFISRTGDFGRADVGIRGLGDSCRQIAVLVNGKPEKMGLFGCAVSHAFPLDNVDRVEVIKGPASVLYGGEALGGVVNIITRLPEKTNESDLSVNLGAYETRLINFRQGGHYGKFRYSLSLDYRSSNGHVVNSQYSGVSLTSGLQYDLSSRSSLRLHAKYFSGEKHEPGTIQQPIDGLWNDYKRGAVDLTFRHHWSDSQIDIKFFHNFGDHEFSDGWLSTDFTSGAMIRYTSRIFPSQVLTIGGDLRFFGGESFNWPRGYWEKKEGAVFIHDSLVLGSQLIVNGGLRYHLDSLYGSKWCPRLGCVFHLTDHTALRADLKNGFRSPQINELYMYPPANPDLKPEEVWNYEIGIKHHFTHRLFLDADVYLMRGSNMIRTIPNPAGPPPFIFANTGEFEFLGFDLEMSAYLSRNLTALLSYSYIDFGEYTKGRPGQKINFNLKYRSQSLLVLLSGSHVSRYYAADHAGDSIPDYLILNSRWIYSLSSSVAITLDINNILNTDYQVYGEFPGLSAGLYQMPGRYIQLGFKFSLHSGQ